MDIVHTEICSLHNNLSKHETHTLVSQSLFADGFIKYSMVKDTHLPSLQVLRVKEEIIPDSRGSMTWEVAPWGFEMFLGKEVGVLIVRHLPGYLERIKAPQNALFAIHPGGPKILSYVQKALGLKDAQLAHSYEILKNYGNMSSATLPHIWEKILNDPEVSSGTPIVSLAFGPGLNFAGAIMEKRCGS
jgi:predicted naringenin-chalcone synthase